MGSGTKNQELWIHRAFGAWYSMSLDLVDWFHGDFPKKILYGSKKLPPPILDHRFPRRDPLQVPHNVQGVEHALSE